MKFPEHDEFRWLARLSNIQTLLEPWKPVQIKKGGVYVLRVLCLLYIFIIILTRPTNQSLNYVIIIFFIIFIGDIYYFNFTTGLSVWDHPNDIKFKRLFLKYQGQVAIRKRWHEEGILGS